MKAFAFLTGRVSTGVAAVVVILLAAVSHSRAVTGLDWIDNNTNLTFYGDLRLRYEVDRASQNAAGVERAARPCHPRLSGSGWKSAQHF